MATQLHTEITIAAQAERVWEVLTTFERYPEWNPFISSITGKTEVGSRLVARLNAGGRQMTIRPRLLAADRPRELRWRGSLGIPGLFDGEHRFRLEPAGAGSVRFIQEERFSGVLAPLVLRFIGEETRQGFEAMNDALKARAEQAQPAMG